MPAPEQPGTEQQPAPERHGPEQHGPEQHGPEQHGPEQHGPEQHGPEQHGPEQHAAATVGRRFRRRRRLVQAVMAVCVLALLPSAWTHAVAGDRLRTTADAPVSDVAVVFGAGLWRGRPTPYLAHRLDAAAELYRAGRVKVVLVTGDNSRTEYDEPDAMRTYLTAHGVPADRVVSDHAGFDSWDSCVRAKKIFGVDRAVLISQGFHIRRAVALCQAAGVESYGVGVSEPLDATWYYGGAREVFAAGKAALDAVVKPDPHFLGPREEGVARALDRAAGPRP